MGVVNSNSPMKIGYDHCNETLSYRSNEKMYVVYKICHPMLFEFTADRIYDLFYIYIYISLNSNTYKIISRLYPTRGQCFFLFFFELVKVYYKSNKVEEHLNMIVTI